MDFCYQQQPHACGQLQSLKRINILFIDAETFCVLCCSLASDITLGLLRSIGPGERERERALVFEKCISNVFNIAPSACRCISGPKLSDRPQDYPDEKFRLLLKI